MSNYLKTGLIIITLIIITSCQKKEEKTLVLIRDCTATYLRDGDIDLPIINFIDLIKIDSGQVVTAKYHYPKTNKVKAKYGEGCGVPHGFERGEWIIIDKFN